MTNHFVNFCEPSNLEELARYIGINQELLLRLIDPDKTAISPNWSQTLYRKHEIPKKSPHQSRQTRIVWEPLEIIASHFKVFKSKFEIFLTNVNSKYPHPNCYGFIKGRGILENARNHCGASLILRTDIENFFNSISIERLKDNFLNLEIHPDVSDILSKFVTINGTLPSGLHTSPVMANMVCLSLDDKLLELSKKYIECTYTRYADDITFSGKEIPEKEDIYQILLSEKFLMSSRKFRITKPGQAHYVTGLSVTGNTPRAPRKMKKNLRQELYYLKKFGLEEHFKHIGGQDDYVRHGVNRIDGTLRFLRHIEKDKIKHQIETWNNLTKMNRIGPSYSPQSKYEKDGKTYYKVYVNLRSRTIPTLREQRRALDLTSEKAAVLEEKKLLREAMEELARAEGKGLRWEEIVGQWELSMRQDGVRYAPTTIQDNVAQMYNWTKPWLKKPASELCKADGRDVLKNVIDSGRSKGFVKHVKSTINIIFQWGIEHRLIHGVHESPVKGINLDSRKEEKIPEILTVEEIKQLLDAAKKLEHEWYPVWAVALLTGMRNGELFALRWEDVDLSNRKISVSRSYNTRMRADKCTKSGKWRTIPISDELLGVLVELKNSAGTREHVFPRLQGWAEGWQANIIRRFCIGIGLRSIRFHALRACFATQLLSNDVAPARVMKICGWQDLKTMQHYVRLAGVDERGATDSLKLIPSSEECMDKVVRILDFKNGKS